MLIQDSKKTCCILFPFIRSPKEIPIPLSAAALPQSQPFLHMTPSTRKARKIAPATAPVTMITTFLLLPIEGGLKSVEVEKLLSMGQFIVMSKRTNLKNVTHKIQTYQLIGWFKAQLKSFYHKVSEVVVKVLQS